MSRASDKDGKNAGLSMNTSHGTRHIFHSNLLQIIIVFCPSAQTQINFLIKQVWFRHLLFAAPICLFLSLSSKHINKHRKEEAFGIVYITPFRFILVIKSYTFAFCIFLYRIPDQYNRWYWVRCLAFCRHIYFFFLLPASRTRNYAWQSFHHFAIAFSASIAFRSFVSTFYTVLYVFELGFGAT